MHAYDTARETRFNTYKGKLNYPVAKINNLRQILTQAKIVGDVENLELEDLSWSRITPYCRRRAKNVLESYVESLKFLEYVDASGAPTEIYLHENEHPEGAVGYKARIDQLEDGKAWEICQAMVLGPLLEYSQVPVTPPQASTTTRTKGGSKTCKMCGKPRVRDEYPSKKQWNKKNPTCTLCTAGAADAKKPKVEAIVCVECKNSKPKNEFTKDQRNKFRRNGTQPTCKACQCPACRGYGKELTDKGIGGSPCTVCSGTGKSP